MNKKGVLFKMLMLIFVVASVGAGAAYWNFLELKKLSAVEAELNRMGLVQTALHDQIGAINSVNLAAMDALVDRSSGEVAPELVEELETSFKRLNETQALVKSAFKTQDLSEQFDKYWGHIELLDQTTRQLFESVKNKVRAESVYAEFDDKIDGDAVAAKEIAKTISQSLITSVAASRKTYEQTYERTKFSLMLSSILTVLLLVAMGLPIALQVVRPLVGVTKSLSESTNTLIDVQSDIESSQGDLKSVVDDQSAAIHQTTAAMEQTKRSLERSLEFLSQSVKMATGSRAKSQSGEQTMQELFDAMADLKNSSQSLDTMLNLLKQIAAKTDVINSIVFKTQVLSVNASIEAARAGQYGKGFSVVAEEVGNLATLSGESAQQIHSLILNSIKTAQEVTTELSQKVEFVFQINQQAREAFRQIATDMEDIHQRLDALEKSQVEQSTGVSQTLQAMQVINSGALKCSDVAGSFVQLVDRLSTEVQQLENDTGRTREVVLGRQIAS